MKKYRVEFEVESEESWTNILSATSGESWHQLSVGAGFAIWVPPYADITDITPEPILDPIPWGAHFSPEDDIYQGLSYIFTSRGWYVVDDANGNIDISGRSSLELDAEWRALNV